MTEMPSSASNWEEVRSRLDERKYFDKMKGTPYYRDAIYPGFSKEEYARRYAAIRRKMAERKIDCLIVPGGPSAWSFGGGMQWLSGHREWHALAAYLVVPLEGEPTLIYAMSGTHLEAVRRETAGVVDDCRASRQGRFGEVAADRIRELGLEKGRIGILEIDLRFGDYIPVNQFDAIKKALPEAEIILTRGILHELVVVHSTEELDAIRKAGELCTRAMEAIRDRAKPGVTEYQLAAAGSHAVLDGGGDVVFMIIASTPMDNPSVPFGNPRPSARKLQQGDIIIMEIAAAYNGFSAQLGQPICLGEPPEDVRRFWDEIARPGYELMVEAIGPGKPIEGLKTAGEFFRKNGYQSRPIHVHGMDFHTDTPFVFADGVVGEEDEMIMKPGMVLMPEPNPIRADGLLGMFVGHTIIITETGRECVDSWPLELTIV
jgi:Xaa-Pro aminopeptidase